MDEFNPACLVFKELAKKSTDHPLDTIIAALPKDRWEHPIFYRETVQLLEDMGLLKYDSETYEFSWNTEE